MTFQAPFINWAYFLPVLIVVAGGTLVILWDAFFPRRDRSLLVTMTLAVLAAALGAALASGAGGSEALSFSGMFLFDGFSRMVFALLLFSSFMAVLIASAQSSLRDAPAGEYFGLILFATSGMMLMAATRNLLMVFVGLEVFSLSLYVLAGFMRSDLRGNEAAMKYFLLGSFASGFLLYGMALIYGASGSLDLVDIARRLASHAPARGPVFLVGLGFVIVGLGFKVAAVPFNMWTPDVYEGAPTAVTAFMSVGPKVAAFAALFRIFLALGKHAGPDIEVVLWVLAALT
ncbi:MAG: NADH-quinone oxidoreductase subunit N, partial [bacterium]|nr:NADH-quinone oxidoreductase subunit N [bacterium]